MASPPLRARLRCIALALSFGVGIATGCRSSSATQPTTVGQTNPHPQLVDTFAFNTSADTNWVIAIGEVATYLLGHGQVATSGVPTPTRPRLLTDTINISDTIGGPPLGSDLVTPNYLAFDAVGNLWMSVTGSHGDGSVIQYTRAQVSQNGTSPPTITLSGTRTPLGLRFNSKGGLWVVDSAASAVYGYSSLQVATGGGPAADTISVAGITTGAVTWAPINLAVDTTGNLWVSATPRNPPSGGGVPQFIVVEYAAAAVQSSGTPAPTLTLAGSNGGTGPALAFDATGNLWTANAGSSTITEFSAASLTPGSSPTPTVTLTGDNFSGIGDIAIDPNGLLYFGGNAYGGPGPGIFALPAAALERSGSPTPNLNYTPPTGVTHFTIR